MKMSVQSRFIFDRDDMTALGATDFKRRFVSDGLKIRPLNVTIVYSSSTDGDLRIPELTSITIEGPLVTPEGEEVERGIRSEHIRRDELDSAPAWVQHAAKVALVLAVRAILND